VRASDHRTSIVSLVPFVHQHFSTYKASLRTKRMMLFSKNLSTLCQSGQIFPSANHLQVRYMYFSPFPINAYHLLDLSISHASHSVATQPFSFVPEIGTCSDAQPLSGGRHQQLRLPTVQGGEEKVRCTWLGCSRVVKRDSHARHVDECHLRKVRDVCTGCGRGFSRMYMKKNHLCQGPLSKRRSF
jgi:hypothetical protein